MSLAPLTGRYAWHAYCSDFRLPATSVDNAAFVYDLTNAGWPVRAINVV